MIQPRTDSVAGYRLHSPDIPNRELCTVHVRSEDASS
ncbi:hypothetical protein LINPERPRIM_LOCUS352 [Linum perenne]